MAKVVTKSNAAVAQVEPTARVRRRRQWKEDRSFIILVFRRLPPSNLPFFFFFLVAILCACRSSSVLRSISILFRLYLGDSLVGAITYLTLEISARVCVSSSEFPCEKRTHSVVANAPDAARSIRSSLIQPLLRSRRNSWLIRSHSAKRVCFRQPVISNSFQLPSDSDSYISRSRVPFVKKITLCLCYAWVSISHKIIFIKCNHIFYYTFYLCEDHFLKRFV